MVWWQSLCVHNSHNERSRYIGGAREVSLQLVHPHLDAPNPRTACIPQGEKDGVYIWRVDALDSGPVHHHTASVCGTASVGFHNRLAWSPDGQVWMVWIK